MIDYPLLLRSSSPSPSAELTFMAPHRPDSDFELRGVHLLPVESLRTTPRDHRIRRDARRPRTRRCHPPPPSSSSIGVHPMIDYPLLLCSSSPPPSAELTSMASPPPDSDLDLRGVHLLPVEEAFGLLSETIEVDGMRGDLELDLVTPRHPRVLQSEYTQ